MTSAENVILALMIAAMFIGVGSIIVVHVTCTEWAYKVSTVKGVTKERAYCVRH